jgi:hypothetical protein
LDRPLPRRNADIFPYAQVIAVFTAHDSVGAGIDQLADVVNNSVDKYHYSFPGNNLSEIMGIL